MSIEETIGIILLGVPLVLGTLGVIIEKIKTGHWYNGQGYGK